MLRADKWAGVWLRTVVGVVIMPLPLLPSGFLVLHPFRLFLLPRRFAGALRESLYAWHETHDIKKERKSDNYNMALNKGHDMLV